MDCNHCILHSIIFCTIVGGSLNSAQIVSVQGSLLIKCSVQNILGGDEIVIIQQERQLFATIEGCGTVIDMTIFSLNLNAEVI